MRVKGELLEDLVSDFDIVYKDKIKVLKENIQIYGKKYSKFIGYMISCKSKGEHYNDGQLVEYTFTFKSPKKEITKITTLMCLMNGWDFDDETIK